MLIVVGAHNMPSQVRRTLISLTPTYQASRLENIHICLIDNSLSSHVIHQDLNFSPWTFEFSSIPFSNKPIHHLIDTRIKSSSEDIVGVLIDGARLVSNQVIDHACHIITLSPFNIVSVPNYQLGSCMQMRNPLAVDDKFNEKLLKSINWPHSNCSDLIRISSMESHAGSDIPLFETNCLFVSRYLYNLVGGFDYSFRRSDGGFASADLFSRLVNLSNSRLYILHKEGSFHQFHGGTTTADAYKTEKLLKEMTREYLAIRKKPFSFYRGERTLYP